MSVVVRNELDSPFYFGSGSERKRLDPGNVDTISQTELESVPFDKRGPGKINILWPNQATSQNPQIQLDYYTTGGQAEVRYMGVAPEGVGTDELKWVVRRFSHQVLGGITKITSIDVKENVAWDDRATLWP